MVIKNKSMSVIFISTCAVFMLSLFLIQSGYLINISYGLHESLSIIPYAGLFIIPIQVIMGLVTWIKYKREKAAKPIINPILNIVSVFIFMACIIVFLLFINGVTTSGAVTANEFEKYELNQGYFIKIGNRMIKVSQEQYDIIQPENCYVYEYKWNKLIPNEYKLVYFELFDDYY